MSSVSYSVHYLRGYIYKQEIFIMHPPWIRHRSEQTLFPRRKSLWRQSPLKRLRRPGIFCPSAMSELSLQIPDFEIEAQNFNPVQPRKFSDDFTLKSLPTLPSNIKFHSNKSHGRRCCISSAMETFRGPYIDFLGRYR
jgi:hypothetical protein